jgi:integrase
MRLPTFVRHLPRSDQKNFAAVKDPAQLAQLLRAIDGYRGHPVTALALKLAPLVFVRPGELRGAEWSEFDWVAAEWRMPATRMRMGQLHVVPLSRQALAILSELRPLAPGGRLVFPSIQSRDRPMSDNTTNAALRRLGTPPTHRRVTASGVPRAPF